MKSARIGAVLAAAALSTPAFSAGNTPITSGPQALRATLIGFQLSDDLRARKQVFADLPRALAADGLEMLATRTTIAALVATPSGIEFPCSTSGTLKARLAPGFVRVLKMEWMQCAFDMFGLPVTVDGPVEVTFLGNSLAPEFVASIRAGDRQRDVTRMTTFPPSPRSGDQAERWNLRLSGLLPMQRLSGSIEFPGRVTYEVTGFYQLTQFVRDFPNTGPPFYPQTTTYGAEGVFATGEFTFDAERFLYDNRVFSGTYTERFERPSMPNHPTPVSLMGSYRATNLWGRIGFDPALGKRFYRIDGKVEHRLGQLWGYTGCTAPETYVYQTRAPITEYPNDALFFILDAGELSINGGTTARFSISGTEPFVDLTTRLNITVPNLGAFEFSNPFSIFELFVDAGCVP